jgi:hypothetical protein
LGNGVIEVGFGVDEKGHDRREASTNVITTQPFFWPISDPRA